VNVTEDHCENQIYAIHLGSKHQLRHLQALFSSTRTRPDYNTNIITIAKNKYPAGYWATCRISLICSQDVPYDPAVSRPGYCGTQDHTQYYDQGKAC
jgi:hypothetical protein